MTHGDLFERPEPVREETTHQLDLPEGDIFEKANFAASELGISGKMEFVRENNDAIVARYYRPGWQFRIRIQEDGTTLFQKVKENRHRTLVVFHRIHGYGDQMIYNFYVLLMDLSSIALIWFVLSGLFMWWKRSRWKWFGVMLFTAASGYVLLVVSAFL